MCKIAYVVIIINKSFLNKHINVNIKFSNYMIMFINFIINTKLKI